MDDPDIVTELLVTLRDEGIRLSELSVQKPTLDEVFLTITGRPVETDADADSTDSTDTERISA
jgi:ABC-2 type transport system ATP-binding protein